jgi:hypothetical protein
MAHANADTPNAYTPNTHIARTFEAYIVRIDRFTTPVATFACENPIPINIKLAHHIHLRSRGGGGWKNKTHEKENGQ